MMVDTVLIDANISGARFLNSYMSGAKIHHPQVVWGLLTGQFTPAQASADSMDIIHL
jgi:hypothetical protein